MELQRLPEPGDDHNQATIRFCVLNQARAWRQNVARRTMLLPITAPESPVWHILIEIYIAQAEAKPVSITDVGLLVNMPQSTTLRFLAILTDHHLVERTADPCDRRRIWVTLRNSGIAAVEAMLGHLDIEMAYARTI